MDKEYPMWLYVKQVSKAQSSNKVNLIILGDSRAKAGFMPNELPNIKSLNLSLGGGTPIESYYILKSYLENNSAPSKIILSYVSGHLSTLGLYWKRTIPFEFLDDDNYQEIESIGKKLNIKAITDEEKTYLDYKLPQTYASNFKNGIINMRWYTNKNVLADSYRTHGHHFFGTSSFSNGLSGDVFKKSFKESKIQDYFLKKLITLMATHNITPYFYFMPFNESSFKKANPEYIQEYEQYIINLSTAYNINICNHVFYMKNNAFGDPSHLFNGAKENTQLMNDCIKD